MKRSSPALIAYLALILAPAGMLAFFAFQLAGREYAEGKRRLQDRLAAEADALGRRVEAAVEEAAARAEARLSAREGGVGYCSGSGLTYTPPPPETPAVDPEELALYRLALRGGESFELQHGDPDRALDAYAFFLPRIRAPVLRARLGYLSGRAALAAGRKALGRAILAGLFRKEEAALTEEGYPVDLLAGLALLGEEEAVSAAAFLDRLTARSPHLSTLLLEHLLDRAPGHESLEQRSLGTRIRTRKALEAAVARHPEIRGRTDVVLAGNALLVAQGTFPGRAVCLEPVALPSLEIAGIDVTLSPGVDAAEKDTDRLIRAAVQDRRSVVARLRLRDLRRADRLATLETRRLLQYALVALLVLLTLGSGTALMLAQIRERRLVRLREQLLANVTHELKTPVTSLRMFAEMLARDPLDASQTKRFGRLMLGESRRLTRLIENILDFSVLDRTGNEMEREPTDVAAVLRAVGEAFAYQAGKKNVDFEMNIPADGLDAFTHAPGVERITWNLLDNALKYRRPEGAVIRLRCAAASRRLRILIEDNGPGIPPGEQEQVFEPLYRVRYDDPAVRGSGLGLAISRRLARALGGDVLLESRVGKGSTFTLELPLEA